MFEEKHLHQATSERQKKNLIVNPFIDISSRNAQNQIIKLGGMCK